MDGICQSAFTPDNDHALSKVEVNYMYGIGLLLCLTSFISSSFIINWTLLYDCDCFSALFLRLHRLRQSRGETHTGSPTPRLMAHTSFSAINNHAAPSSHQPNNAAAAAALLIPSSSSPSDAPSSSSSAPPIPIPKPSPSNKRATHTRFIIGFISVADVGLSLVLSFNFACGISYESLAMGSKGFASICTFFLVATFLWSSWLFFYLHLTTRKLEDCIRKPSLASETWFTHRDTQKLLSWFSHALVWGLAGLLAFAVHLDDNTYDPSGSKQSNIIQGATLAFCLLFDIVISYLTHRALDRCGKMLEIASRMGFSRSMSAATSSFPLKSQFDSLPVAETVRRSRLFLIPMVMCWIPSALFWLFRNTGQDTPYSFLCASMTLNSSYGLANLFAYTLSSPRYRTSIANFIKSTGYSVSSFFYFFCSCCFRSSSRSGSPFFSGGQSSASSAPPSASFSSSRPPGSSPEDEETARLINSSSSSAYGAPASAERAESLRSSPIHVASDLIAAQSRIQHSIGANGHSPSTSPSQSGLGPHQGTPRMSHGAFAHPIVQPEQFRQQLPSSSFSFAPAISMSPSPSDHYNSMGGRKSRSNTPRH